MPPPGPSPSTRAYYRARAMVERLSLATLAAFDGACLGVLDRDRLAAIDEAYYAQQTHYLDDGYNNKGLSDWEQAAIDAHFTPGSRVGVTGAGGGREVLALRKQGFDALGYECNDALAAGARRVLADAGVGGDVRAQPRDRWPDDGERFDAVVVGWGSYMLTPGRHRRIEFLRDVARHVDAGAPVLLSFFARGELAPYHRIVDRVARPLRRLRGQEPPDPGDSLRPNFVHFFDEAQLRSEVEEAGLELVDYGVADYGWAVARARSETPSTRA